jgi:hypothetical protein
MGDEIFEGEVCSKCGRQGEIYCDYCCEWHCLDCLIAEEGAEGRSYVPLDEEIRELEEQLPEDF